MAEPRSAALTAASAVNGGATATCASVFTFSLSSFTSCTASPEVLCIFQFPQMNLRLATDAPSSSFLEDFDPRELAAFEEFEGGATTGGDVGDLVGHSHLRDGRRRVAAADHGARAAAGRLGESFGDCPRSRGELGHLEEPHGPVPEDGLRPQDALPVLLARLRSDVETERPLRNLGHD